MSGFSINAAVTQRMNEGAPQSSKVTARQKKDIDSFINQVEVPAGMQADNAPENLYGVVMVNGKVVGAVYKSGAAMLSDGAGAKVLDLMEANAGGPGLAQKRLDLIAEALGGEIHLAPLSIAEDADPAQGLTVSVKGESPTAMTGWWQSGGAHLLAQEDRE